jgi:hypothetical protein
MCYQPRDRGNRPSNLASQGAGESLEAAVRRVNRGHRGTGADAGLRIGEWAQKQGGLWAMEVAALAARRQEVLGLGTTRKSGQGQGKTPAFLETHGGCVLSNRLLRVLLRPRNAWPRESSEKIDVFRWAFAFSAKNRRKSETKQGH